MLEFLVHNHRNIKGKSDEVLSIPTTFLLHLLVAGCDIGVRFSVRPSVRPSVRLSTFMSTFDVYVKVSILINYKTKQPSNPAWNISLTSWLCDIGVRFSVCLSIRPSVCQHLCRSSTFYVKVSILINYKTKQPSNLAWNISLTSWLRHRCPLFHSPVCSSVRLLTVLLCRSSTFMSKFVF